MATGENLKEAFAGESKAYMKYLAYASRAEKEGHRRAARLFKALAEAELIHAQNHFKVMNEIGPSEKNISCAIDGETYEFTQMYPEYIRQAELDSQAPAALGFKRASAAEKIHAALLADVLTSLGQGGDGDYYVCPVCGHTFFEKSPHKCPTCGATRDKFKVIK